MDGIILVNKPTGMTSRDVVNKVGRILKTKKIGHTGTLDPLASGVLVLCVGKATKLVELLTATEKEYIAEVTLGIETDTLDSTGKVLKEEDCKIEEKRIRSVLQNMIGTYDQEVPLYSAIHINGKKLYEYARNEEEVSLPSRTVTIHELEFLEVKDENKFMIKTKVSKGTYIRSLIRDIAYNLNTVGIMSALTRTKQGKYKLEDSVTLEQIEVGDYEILSIKEVLSDYQTVVVDSFLEQKIKYGQILKNIYGDSTILFVNEQEIPLALYHTYEKDREYLKPWKMF